MVKLDIIARPEWLTDNFLKTCVRNSKELSKETELKIDDVSLTYVVPKGENYMSVLWRAEIKYHEDSTEKNIQNNVQYLTESVIIKVSHEVADMIKLSTEIFSREIKMYENIIPALHDILSGNKIETKLACRSLNTINGTNPIVLAIEDLKVQDYTIAERQKGLDMKHCKLTLKKLAQLHSASMHYFYAQSENNKNEYCSVPFFPEDSKEQDRLFIDSARSKGKHLVELMSTARNKYERAINYFNIYIEQNENLIDRFHRGTNLKKANKFYGILHGDCWANNIMFKYTESGSLDDALFVDWQGSRYWPVVGDFLYFFFTSVSLEVRKKHYIDLRDFYFDSLTKNLKTIGYLGQIPTQKEFLDELKNNSAMAMFALLFALPLIMVTFDSKVLSREETDAFSMNQMKDLIKEQNNTSYDEVALESIIILQREGILDEFTEHLD